MTSFTDDDAGIEQDGFRAHLLDLIEADQWGELELQAAEITARGLDRDNVRRPPTDAASLWTVPADQSVVYCRAPFPMRQISVMNWTGVDFQLTLDGGEQLTVRAGKTFPFVPPHGTQSVKVASTATGTGFFGLCAFRKAPAAPFPGFDIGGGAGSGSNVVVTNFPATQPVSGVFWPATQPVSGVFWQATQPVSAIAGGIADLAHGQATMANSVPVVIASNQGAIPTLTGNSSTGTQGNLWNAAIVGAGGVSAAINNSGSSNSCVVGNASAATTINLQFSLDTVNYYTVAQAVLSAAGDFAFTNLRIPQNMNVRLQSTAAATITASIKYSAN